MPRRRKKNRDVPNREPHLPNEWKLEKLRKQLLADGFALVFAYAINTSSNRGPHGVFRFCDPEFLPILADMLREVCDQLEGKRQDAVENIEIGNQTEQKGKGGKQEWDNHERN